MINHELTTFLCAAGTLCVDRTQVQASRTALVIVNSDVRDLWHGPQYVTLDPQLRSMLQWVAASMADIPQIQLSPDRELQQVIMNVFINHLLKQRLYCVFLLFNIRPA